MHQVGNPGKSRDVCDHPALFLTNNHAILKCLLASYSTVAIVSEKSTLFTFSYRKVYLTKFDLAVK